MSPTTVTRCDPTTNMTGAAVVFLVVSIVLGMIGVRAISFWVACRSLLLKQIADSLSVPPHRRRTKHRSLARALGANDAN